MATNDSLLLALAGQAGAVDPSPWSGAGQSILSSQLPRATNNTEAILGPILQGLIGGGLQGYGQGQTNKASFDAYAQNPIIQSLQGDNPNGIGPVASGNEYSQDLTSALYSGDMPANWSPSQGKSDILSALITKQAVLDDEEAKKAIRNKLAEASATAEGKLMGEAKGNAALSELGIVDPASPLGKERLIKDAKNQSIDFIKSKFEQAKKLTGSNAGLTANSGVPTPEGNELSALADSVIVQIDKVLGREINSDVRQRMLNLAPKWYDSATEIDKKSKNLISLVESLSTPTPLLDSKIPKSEAPIATTSATAGVDANLKQQYNALRASGKTAEEAKAILSGGVPRSAGGTPLG